MSDPAEPDRREQLRVLAAHITADIRTLVHLGRAWSPPAIIGLGRLALALLIAAAAERFLGWDAALVTTVLVAAGLGFGGDRTVFSEDRAPSADAARDTDLPEDDSEPDDADRGSR